MTLFDPDDELEPDNDSDDFITLRLYPETAEMFCKALQTYAEQCDKSKKAAIRDLSEAALKWVERLRDAVGEIFDDKEDDA